MRTTVAAWAKTEALIPPHAHASPMGLPSRPHDRERPVPVLQVVRAGEDRLTILEDRASQWGREGAAADAGSD